MASVGRKTPSSRLTSFHRELKLAELPNYLGIQSQMDSIAFVFGMKEYL
jgi:hypothetical protein